MAEKEKPKIAAKSDVRRIVRLMSTDVNGELSVIRALRRVKGVSFMFANFVSTSTGVDKKKKIGTLADEDVKKLEAFIKAPAGPKWMLNRRKDIETGADSHITMAELDLKKREDINLLKRIHAYKGVRHELGQPVRGQRTRSSFRTSRSVGVSRKKIQQAAKPAQAPKPAQPEKK